MSFWMGFENWGAVAKMLAVDGRQKLCPAIQAGPANVRKTLRAGDAESVLERQHRSQVADVVPGTLLT